MVKTEIDVPAINVGQERCCLNCNTLLTDQFCPHCGQKDFPKRQTLKELSFNFFSSFTGYESKFFVTVRYLLLKPGFLANEYNSGKRERYFHPARMYVFISFVYFLLFTSLPETNTENGVLKINTTSNEIKLDPSDEKDMDFLTRESYDSAQHSLPVEARDGWFTRKWKYRQIELEKEFSAHPMEFVKKVVEDFTSHFSQVFFLLLPVFAFILWLLYFKHDFFYQEHLLFSIWCYNFFFIVGSLILLANAVPWLKWISVFLEVAILVYLLVAMKRSYKQSWGKTLLKYGVFLTFFGISTLAVLFINLLITLIFI